VFICVLDRIITGYIIITSPITALEATVRRLTRLNLWIATTIISAINITRKTCISMRWIIDDIFPPHRRCIANSFVWVDIN
jgi:hypothetical protein